MNAVTVMCIPDKPKS